MDGGRTDVHVCVCEEEASTPWCALMSPTLPRHSMVILSTGPGPDLCCPVDPSFPDTLHYTYVSSVKSSKVSVIYFPVSTDSQVCSTVILRVKITSNLLNNGKFKTRYNILHALFAFSKRHGHKNLRYFRNM